MDIAYGSATLLTNQSMTIMPSSATDHYIIHNIIMPFGSTCELYQTNGSTTVLVLTTSTSLLSYNFHCSQDSYYTLKNVGTLSINVAYDGVVV